MSIPRNRINQVLAKVNATLPTLILQNYTVIPNSGNSVFRIIASHGKPVSDKKLTISDYLTMANEKFGDQLSIVPGSLEHVTTTKDSIVISSLIAANTVSKSVTRSELRSNYKVVSSNVFMDDEDKIWRMVGEGDDRRLVQAIKEDLNDILSSRMARISSQIIANCSINYMGIVPERGDYAIYYNTTAMDYDYGFVAIAGADIYIAPRLGNSTQKIVADQIIDCVDNKDLPESKQDKKVLSMMFGEPRATTQNFSEDMAKEYLDYYRQIYADTPFFDKLEEHIADRRNLANVNRHLTTMDIQ